MSAKRRADNQLGPDNWDQEEPAEPEEDGNFKMASREILEKRVIRTAKRRMGNVVQKAVFSGFSGFNKLQKPSFDFLANLTNGSKSNNESSTLKRDTAAVSSSSMTTKPATGPSSGIFSLSGASMTKSAFGHPKSETTIFGGTESTPAFTQSVFSSSKPDSTVNDNPFKGQSSVTSTPFTNFTMQSNANTEKPISQVSSTLYGVTSANISNNSPFSTTSQVNSSPQSTEVNNPVNESVLKDDKKIVYYNNLKSLNESVSEWIKKHVEETPVCILTPIFKDYEKHLKNIQDECDKREEASSKTDTTENTKEPKSPTSLNTGSTLFSNSSVSTNSVFSSRPSPKISAIENTSNFTFGINTPTNVSTAAKPSTGFSFGIKPTTSTAPFATNITSSANNFAAPATPSTGFAFGLKPSSVSASSLAANTTVDDKNSSTPSTSDNNFTAAVAPSTGFSFGIKLSSASTSPFATNTTMSAHDTNGNIQSTSPFATKTTTSANDTNGSTQSNSPFSTKTNCSIQSTSPFATNVTSIDNSSKPFSFGVGKPFAFNSNIKNSDDPTNETNSNEDEPPKVEYAPITEENSVYDKKCKVFIKKNGNFVDMGVGTLYIKKIEESGKHQLLVRANTSLGNIIINMILSSSVPTQRMGKNNVMMICIPTPDAMPPPTSILVRVKTTEDADELLKTLNKYKA